MALAVLGPVRLDGPDGPVAIEGRKTRQVLTLLALAAPRPVSVDSIARSLWDEPPPAAVKTVQAHLSRVRTALAAAHPAVGTVEGSSAGYRLVTGPGAWTSWRSTTCADGPGSARWPGTTRPRRPCSARRTPAGAATPSCRRPPPGTPRTTGWPRSGCCSPRTTSTRCSPPGGPPR